MTTPPVEPARGDPGDAWLMPNDEIRSEVRSPDQSARRRRLGTVAGLVVAGVLAGAVAVTAWESHASTSANSPTVGTGSGSLPQGGGIGAPGGQAGLGGPGGQGGSGGPGGLAGEEHVLGTLTAVGPSTVTVNSSGTTATYTVTANTQIVRNGTETTLSALKAGDQVLVHVYPSGSGSSMLVERIFAGQLPTDGAPPNGDGQNDGSDDDGGTTT
jgi:hypothetical protein